MLGAANCKIFDLFQHLFLHIQGFIQRGGCPIKDGQSGVIQDVLLGRRKNRSCDAHCSYGVWESARTGNVFNFVLSEVAWNPTV